MNGYPQHGRPKARLTRCKSDVLHERTTVASLKSSFRNKFFDHLRTNRTKTVDRFRQIAEDKELKFETVEELKDILMNDPEARQLLSAEEVIGAIEQANMDAKKNEEQAEVEKRSMQDMSETESIVNNLMINCVACKALTANAEFCDICMDVMNILNNN